MTIADLTQTPDHAGAPARRAILVAALLFWGVHYGLLATRASIVDLGGADMLEVQLRRIPGTLVGLLLSLGMFRLLKPLRQQRFEIRVAAAALLVIPAAGLYGLANDMLLWYVLPSLPTVPYEMIMFWQDMFPWLGSFASWAALMTALDYSQEVRDRERRLAQVEAAARDAQLEALRHQMNPHFLFNTLNAISSMIWERDPARAEEMLVCLADFLRSTLELDPTGDITLAEEIELQRNYLAIEQYRFPTRLKVDYAVPADLAQARVPGLILQPLVENAIKYAVSPSRATTHMRIVAERSADGLVLLVEDDGAKADTGKSDGRRPGGTGLGLSLVRRRLEARFGEAGRLTAEPRAPAGFRARVVMPLSFAS